MVERILFGLLGRSAGKLGSFCVDSVDESIARMGNRAHFFKEKINLEALFSRKRLTFRPLYIVLVL